ncbi:MAG: amidohydrolase [Acidimicrobiia bacterium]|nr:amidohydrolase [Acidimicrobiia bacterium]
MTDLDFAIVDADNHYYERDDCFTRHIEARFADRAVNIRRPRPDPDSIGQDADGPHPYGTVHIGDRRLKYFTATPSDATGRPGALQTYFKGASGKGDALLAQGLISADDIPASQDRTLRLRLMDTQGVEAALLFPTLAVGIEHELRHDAPALFANLRSFNRWLEEDWTYGHNGRTIGVPLLSLLDINLAVVELDRVLDAGAKAIYLKAGPIPGRSPADPSHDPFWARCEEAAVPVLFHLGNPGLTEFYSALWGERPNPPSHRLSPFQRLTSFTERTITDTLAALIFHNLFGRFPNLSVASIEHGGDWVPSLLRKMDRAVKMTGPKDWLFGPIADRPSEVFRRHIKVNPFPEEKVQPLAAAIGIENVLGGSDWPHPEGTASPADLVQLMPDLSDTELRAVLRDNTASLIRL